MQKCTLALGCFWKPEMEFDNFNGIVGLIVEQGEEGIYYLNLQANPRLSRAMGDIEGALFFATLDASQVGFVITLKSWLVS